MRLSTGWKRRVGTGVLAGIGVVTLAVPLYDIWADVATPPYASLLSTVVENSLPVALALVLLGAVVSLRRADWAGDELYRTAKWTGLAAAVAAVLMLWVLGIQVVVQNHPKPHIVAANAVIVAAVAGLAVGVNDVKKRRRRRSLQTERDHFSALYEHTTDAIVTFGPAADGVDVTKTNRTFDRLADRGPRGFLSRLELTDDATGVDDLAPVDAVRNGDALDVEVRAPLADGDRYFKLRVVPTNNRHTYLLLTDITQQKERERLLEERGERLEREKSKREAELEERTNQLEFLHSLLRHDVQNGMMVIRSRAEFLADRVDDSLAEYADTIVSRSTDISDQIDRMRTTLETLTSDTWTTRPIPVSTLRDRVDALADAHPDADVAVDGSLPDVAVRADEMFADVLDNVLRNGVEHNDSEPPRVRASATVDAGTVRIEIADDGPGIPDEKRDSVFRRGVSSAEESGDSGSGFGLFFVDAMMDAYDGDVWVTESDAGGARFVLELPKADPEKSDAEDIAVEVE